MPGGFFFLPCSSPFDEGPFSMAMCVVPFVYVVVMWAPLGQRATCVIFQEENGDRTNNAPVVMVCCTLRQGSNAFYT